MIEHTVKSFGEQLETISLRVVQMGGLTERQLATAIDAMARRNSRQLRMWPAMTHTLTSFHFD